MDNSRKKAIPFSALVLAIVLLMVSVFPFTPLAGETEALSTKEKINNFLSVIGPMATEDMRSSNILASLTIAQGIYESGWGTSDLAKIGNNLFGIKAYSTWKGKAYSTTTKKVYSSYSEAKPHGGVIYRAYASWKDCVADHSHLFNTSSIYKELRGLKDYKRAAYIIVDSGYAGHQNGYRYSENLIYLIEHYNLTKYDVGTSSSSSTKTTTTTTTKTTSATKTTAPTSVTLSEKEITLGVGASYSLKATVSPSKADQTVKWSSSDKAASVSAGNITAVREGTAEITAKASNGVKSVCKVTVKNNYDFVVTGNELVSCFSEDDTVEIPYGITSIKSYAFKDCTSKTVIIPDTVKSISSKAFYGNTMTVKAKKGSAAESSAKSSGLSFKSLFSTEWILSTEQRILTGMSENTSVGTFLSYFSSEKELDILDSRGDSIKDNTLWSISTGHIASIGGKTYKVIIKGDTNGDGKVSEKDCSRIAGYLIGNVELGESALLAADVDFDGEVDITDYVKARAYLCKGLDIYS